jgi:hypothetical protein
MLQMGFRQTQVAGSAYVDRAHAQQNRALNPGAVGNLFFERFCFPPCSGGVEGELLWLRSNRKGSASK